MSEEKMVVHSIAKMRKTFRLASDYDLEYKNKKNDLKFWVNLISELKAKSILELGVGTGRVFFPVVKKLYHHLETAVGLDIDVNLLAEAHKKLDQAYPEIKDKIRLLPADMRSFKLGKKFDFIFIPFNTFPLIYNLEDRLAVLATVKRHLNQGGHFAFEVYAPNIIRLAQKFQKNVATTKEFTVREKGIKLIRQKSARYHPATQITENQYDFRKYELGSNKLIQKYSTKLKLYNFFPTEIRLLFRIGGFSIIHFWGDFDRSEYNDKSPKMIIVTQLSKD